LLEAFEAADITNHVKLLRQAAAAGPRGQQQPAPNLEDENACRVCGVSRLTFEPPCLFCTQCGQRIKRGQVFHATPQEYEIKGYWCHACVQEHKGTLVPFEGSQSGSVKKQELVKMKNENEVEESWVMCSNCEGWVHQICGLFNKGRNAMDTHYLCPDCLVQVSPGGAGGGTQGGA